MSKTVAVALRGCKIAARRRNKSMRFLIMRGKNVYLLMMRWYTVCVRQKGSHDHG
jgi:hypothetical protein